MPKCLTGRTVWPTSMLSLWKVQGASVRRSFCASFRAHVSLDRFSAKFAKRLGSKYIICRGNYETGTNGVTYIPFYMAHCLWFGYPVCDMPLSMSFG